MNPSAFDQLSRTLASASTRRTTLAGLAGTLTALVARLAGVAAPSASARPGVCRPLGGHCFPDHGADCCRGATCQDGRCRCPKRTRRCGNRCLPKRECCRRQECRGNQRCVRGRCQCPAGKKRCQGRCIARDAYCGGCDADHACVNGACAPKPWGNGRPCRVFLTDLTGFQGNLGGVAGADRICQGRATGAGLSGTYRAWLSGSNEESSPSRRFTYTANTGPYVLVNETLIANDWADLTTLKGDDYLRARINVTESGQTLHAGIWTNTLPDGTPNPSGHHCQEWTTGASTVSGEAGSNSQVDAAWTSEELNAFPCNTTLGLYCFEQG